MEKPIELLAYWLGIICTVLALIFRMFTALNWIPPFLGLPGGSALSYKSFLDGAGLFFLLAIASWCRTAKSQGSFPVPTPIPAQKESRASAAHP
jgi:hypothetical protein